MGELGPGSKIAGKYTLIGRGGRGGMADVWIARNESTGAEVAIKTLRPERRGVAEADARFRQEARVSAKLTHPNVARVYDLVEEADGTLLLVMERLRGDTLRNKLAEGALTERAVIDLTLPILEGLAAAHAAGIIHRDVTPANIFLAQEGGRTVPKLIDFGVAKHDESAITTQEGHALGTPQYMSPEQIRSVTLDGRTDLYSLGVTMYEAMTGANPFRRETAGSSLAAVLETDIDPDPRISPRVWLVLSRVLAKQPYERPASAEEMSTALRRAIETSDDARPALASVSSDLSGQIDVAPQPAKRPWGLFAASFALLMVVAITTVALLKKEAPVVTSAAQVPPPAIVVPSASPSASTTAALSASAAPKPIERAPAPKSTGRVKPVATTPGF